MSPVTTSAKAPTFFQIAVHMTLRALGYACLGGISYGFVGGLTGAISAALVMALLYGPVTTSTGSLSLTHAPYALAAIMGGQIAVMTGAVGGILVFLVMGFQPFAPARNVTVFRQVFKGAWLGSNAGLLIGAFVGLVNGAALRLLVSSHAVMCMPLSFYIEAAGGSSNKVWDAALMGAVNGIALGYFLGLLSGAWRGGKRALSQPL